MGMSKETATCRGCGMELRGKPYHKGGTAFHPVTNEECKTNFYGGFACSYECNKRAAQRLENDMPGATPGGNKSLSCYAREHLRDRYPEDTF